MADKLIREDHLCRFCKKGFKIVVHDQSFGLTTQDIQKLREQEIYAIAKGEDIQCPHCEKILCQA